MYEIKMQNRNLPDGKKIITYTRNVINANQLEVEAGTTGSMGGDTGHGGRTYFRIEDRGDTNIKVKTIFRNGFCTGFEVFLGGDAELETTIRALKFIVKVLEEGMLGVYD